MVNEFLDYFNEVYVKMDSDDLYNEFIDELGGKIFGKGLFNSFATEDLDKWQKIVTNVYPEFENGFKLFGYDWLGRCLGIDIRDKNKEQILMFEIGTHDVLEIPCTFEEFLNEEIPLYADACLAESFFMEWLDETNIEISKGKCIGYKVPLFLGGEDSVENLKECDMEIYWSMI